MVVILCFRLFLSRQLSSFHWDCGCVGSTSLVSGTLFLLLLLGSLLVLEIAISALVSEFIMSQAVLMPSFTIAALEGIWDSLGGYVSHDHSAPCFRPPDLDSHYHRNIVR